MAGSIVTTQTKEDPGLSAVTGVTTRPGLRTIVKTSIVWTSDAGGAVSANTVEMPSGSVISVQFIPGTGGAVPTDLYDVTFTNENGINAFDDGTGTSIGANLSATVATKRVPFIGGAASTFVRVWLAGGLYTPVVAAAGNAKSGTINIFQCLDVV